jgi:hypothetical protein
MLFLGAAFDQIELLAISGAAQRIPSCFNGFIGFSSLALYLFIACFGESISKKRNIWPLGAVLMASPLLLLYLRRGRHPNSNAVLEQISCKSLKLKRKIAKWVFR